MWRIVNKYIESVECTHVIFLARSILVLHFNIIFIMPVIRSQFIVGSVMVISAHQKYNWFWFRFVLSLRSKRVHNRGNHSVASVKWSAFSVSNKLLRYSSVCRCEGTWISVKTVTKCYNQQWYSNAHSISNTFVNNDTIRVCDSLKTKKIFQLFNCLVNVSLEIDSKFVNKSFEQIYLTEE